MPRPTLLVATIAVASLAGCATVSRPAAPTSAASDGDLADPVADSSLARPDGASVAGSLEGAADAPPPGSAAGEARPRRDGPGLAARARSLLGLRGPFRVGGARFRDDCSGFVAAVYAAGGLDLRAAMQGAGERRGALAAWRAAEELGQTFGAEEPPAPGDLVFWHDTYDRNRNRRSDDRFTHVGIVERVEDGTVLFLHRGAKGVARGVMTLARKHEARDRDGTPLNSPVRARAHPARRVAGLAGELFAGFARLDALPPTPAGAAVVLHGRTPPRTSAGRRPPR